MEWFNVDRAGLVAQLERRGKSFAVFELVQNAWDSGSPSVAVVLAPIPSSPYALLSVEDWSPAGFADLEHSYTMFAPSSSGTDPSKRGRFNLGEKTVIALCREAEIISTTGSVKFDDAGRTRGRKTRELGTMFVGEIRMTRAELEAATADVARLIPPVPTAFNGQAIERPALLRSFVAALPTEYVLDGVWKRAVRKCTVELYAADGPGEILELGIPVVEAEIGYRVNVLQKIPLGPDRDNVTPAFLKALRVAVVNEMHADLPAETASEGWVQEVAADARIAPDAFGSIFQKRFGAKAVVATVGDPIANAQAEAAGFTVVHGGAMPSGAWANARKFQTVLPASQVFPSMTPEQRAAVAAAQQSKCPACGK